MEGHKRVLITGAGGFIGANLAEHLIDRGFQVTGVDLHFPQYLVSRKGSRLQLVEGDFRNAGLMQTALHDQQIVFHFASAHLQISMSPEAYWDINVHSLPAFLALCQEKGVQRFIHISSVGVYGQLHHLPADETTVCKPQSIYGETKLAGEQVVLQHCREHNMPIVVLRPAWVYGRGCPRTLKLYRTLKRRQFVMIGNGSNLRHPLYIKDMIQACELSMTRASALGNMFVIGGDRAVTTRELVDTFCSTLSLPYPRIALPYAAGKIIAQTAELIFAVLKKEPPLSRRSLEFFDTHNAFDIGKAKSVLGFEPVYSLADGVRDCGRWLAIRT